MIEIPVNKNFTTDEQRPWRFGDCDACPIAPPRVVRGYGTSASGIAVVGESPGQNEIAQGKPFVGQSGQLIRTVLVKLGQNPDEVYYTNSLLCHAEKPHKQAIISCNNRLHEELKDVGSSKILILGAVALQAFYSPAKGQSITMRRGKGANITVGGRTVYALPTYHPAAVLREPEVFRDFAFDVEKFLRNNEPIKLPSPHVYVAWQKDIALQRLSLIRRSSRMSCDIETTGLSSAIDTILSIGFGVQRKDGEIEAHIIPAHVCQNEEVKAALLSILTEYEGKLIFHNGKFDCRMLSVFFGTPVHPKRFTDTLLMHSALDERSSSEATFNRRVVPRRHGLKTLARLEFDVDYGFDFPTFFNKETKTKEDWEELFFYQGLDCAYTLRLETKFDGNLDAGAHRLLDRLLYPASLTLQDVENRGVRLDRSYLENLAKEASEEVNNIGLKLSLLAELTTGVKDWRTENQKKVRSSEEKPFHPGSYTHVKRLLYTEWAIPQQTSMTHLAKERRKLGKEYWPTDDITLTKLAETIDDPARRETLYNIIAYRKKRTILSTNIIGLQHRLDSDDRVRPSFLLHGTVTGRLSCRDPNLQNIPTREGSSIETAFKPDDGWWIVVSDFSQLEIRILAEFSQDPALIKACRESDIHGDIASRVFNKPPDQITSFERKLTKTMVFGTIYGRSAAGIVAGEEMGELVKRGMRRWTKDEGEAFIRRLLDLFPGMNTYFKRARKDALTQHYVQYSLGRKRRFPFITDKSREEVLRQAINAPVQGTASDLCLDALVRLHNKLPREKVHILSIIHDAILFECRQDSLDEMIPMIRQEMETVTLFTPTVPFKVVVKAGPDWGHTEEVAVSC